MSNKITTLTIQVPYKGSGGVIHQNPVSFDVYKIDGHFSLRPCLSQPERQRANLPEELNFVIENGKPVSLRGKVDGNFHVIQDAVVVLKEQNQLV
jgi:hypothetical protein